MGGFDYETVTGLSWKEIDRKIERINFLSNLPEDKKEFYPPPQEGKYLFVTWCSKKGPKLVKVPVKED